MFFFFFEGDDLIREVRGVVLDVCKGCRAIGWISLTDHYLQSNIYGVKYGKRMYRGCVGKCMHCGLELGVTFDYYAATLPVSAVGRTSFQDALAQTNPRLRVLMDIGAQLDALAGSPYRGKETDARLKRVLPALEDLLLSARPIEHILHRFAVWPELDEEARTTLCQEVEELLDGALV